MTSLKPTSMAKSILSVSTRATSCTSWMLHLGAATQLKTMKRSATWLSIVTMVSSRWLPLAIRCDHVVITRIVTLDGRSMISKFKRFHYFLLVRSSRARRRVLDCKVRCEGKIRGSNTAQVWCERCKYPPTLCIFKEGDREGPHPMVSSWIHQWDQHRTAAWTAAWYVSRTRWRLTVI